MNDYWNNPPDDMDASDMPVCPDCGEDMDDQGDGVHFFCVACGAIVTLDQGLDMEPPDSLDGGMSEADLAEWQEEERKGRQCPHGKTGECDACDYLSDIAFDTARERGRL